MLSIMKDFHEKLIPKFYINILNNEYEFYINLYRQVTVILGDSGTGKSTIIRLLDEYLNDVNNMISLTNNENGIIVNTNSKFYIDPNMNDIDYIIENYNVILIDEGNRIIFNDTVINKIINKGIFIVIISRKYFERLNYSIHEIYEINTKYENNKYINKLVKKYNKYNKIDESECILVEDSKSGYEIYKKILYNSKVESSYSNSRIIKKYKNIKNKYNSINIIVDSSNFGPYARRLESIIDKETNILYIESIEWLLLFSIYYFNKLIEYIPEIILEIKTSKLLNFEYLFYKLLQISIEKLNKNEVKSNFIELDDYINKYVNNENINSIFSKSNFDKNLIDNIIIESIRNELLEDIKNKSFIWD